MPFPRNPLQQLIPQRLNAFEKRLKSEIWTSRQPVLVEGGPINDPPVPLLEAQAQDFAPVHPGEYFAGPGNTWQQRWFRFEMPEASDAERGRRILFWDSQGETTVYINGAPWAGLDVAHGYCVLPDHACTVWLDTGTYQTAIWTSHPRFTVEPYGCRFDGAWICCRNRAVWETYWDFACLNALLHRLLEKAGWTGAGNCGHNQPLEKAPALARHLLVELDRACDKYETKGLDALAALLQQLYAKLKAGPLQGHAALCGHAHLDLVWLWPETITQRKAVHSFSTVMRIMAQYPEFQFTQSQPALYDAVKQYSPELYSEIAQQMEAGRWEATGGFEVESDVNLPCGEALARALKYGQERFAEMRPDGKFSSIVWIPDVFGYSNCLPQIMKLGGITGFFTTKMTWSSITRFPHNTFRWRGIDGTEMLTHLCPTGYNGQVEVADLADAVDNHRQSGIHEDVLLPTGYGDGAGGPTEGMCERARRFRDLTGAPRTSWTSVESFFGGLQDLTADLPAYEGELYLEYHRGTYTTQSEFKRCYRIAEQALQAREAVRVVKNLSALPRNEWLRLCFAQFHDAIPGSSIGLVYEQMTPEMKNFADAQLTAAESELQTTRIQRQSSSDLSFFNPLPFPRTAVVALSDQEYAALDAATQKQAQTTVGNGGQPLHLFRVKLPALGSAPAASPQAEPQWEISPRVLDNGIIRAEFNSDGQLSSISIDGVPLAFAAPAEFRLSPDNPAAFDAWDIDRYTLALGEPCAMPITLQVLESGPHRARIGGSAQIGEKSSLTVSCGLETDSPYLRLEVAVDWQEDHTLLKYHVPTKYRGRHARYGAPFGSTERPQYPGYPNEESQWEVPGSRWAALGDDDSDGGIAVMTEAKYGFSCRDGDLGLSLLRAPCKPDPNADRGQHIMRFAMGRHRSSIDNCGALNTAAAADALFAPILKHSDPAASSPFRLGNLGSLTPCWVCPAESCNGYIIRLHETAGGRGTAHLSLKRQPRKVQMIDFLEQPREELSPTTEGGYDVPYTPYQIVSILVDG